MPFQLCTLATIRGRCIAALNAAPAATWATTLTSDDDNRRSETEIDKAINGADTQVCIAIAETLGHPYRPQFTEDTELAHGEEIPTHLGPLEMIRIQLYDGGPLVTGREKDAEDIDAYRNDTLFLYDPIAHDQQGSSLGGYFKVVGNEIRYTGFTCFAMLANFLRYAGICQAPENYEDAVFSLAMMNLIKEGDNAPYANIHMAQGQGYLNQIRGGATVLQPVQVAQSA